MSCRPRAVAGLLLAVFASGPALAAGPATPRLRRARLRRHGRRPDRRHRGDQRGHRGRRRGRRRHGRPAGRDLPELLDPPEEPRRAPARRGRRRSSRPIRRPRRGRYDLPEPNEHDLYQDFGHSHWQNSLIWGIGLEDVAILGPGRIDGSGLTRRGPGARWSSKAGDRPLSMGAAVGSERRPGGGGAARHGRARQQGDRAQALPQRTLRDFSILNGGHFARARDRRRQPHDRQRQDRHQPRRHRHRRLPQRARSRTCSVNSPERRRDRAEELLRARLRARRPRT